MHAEQYKTSGIPVLIVETFTHMYIKIIHVPET
jgi:hypothetical protein